MAAGTAVTTPESDGDVSAHPNGGTPDAVERARTALFEQISSGQLAPGERLREVSLASELGMSRTPVRDALRRLASEGVVELNRNRGAQVASFTAEEVDSLFQVRASIEPMAAALAVQSFADDDLARIEDLCTQMEQIVDSDADRRRITPLNNELHRMFIDGSGNRHLAAAIHSVVRPAVVTHTFRNYDEQQLRRSMRHHRELLDAAKVRDGEWAQAVMRAHILAARHTSTSQPPRSE